MKRLFLMACVITVLYLHGASPLEGAERKGQQKGPQAPESVLGTPVSTKANINRISAWYRANGVEERNPSTGNAGLTFPRGTADAIFAAGLMWTGIHNDGRTPTLRTNGSSYNTGTKPGSIIGLRTGNAEDPAAPDVRIFRVRRDYATADLRQDAAEINSTSINSVSDAQIAAVRDQYATDWREWPWQKGAPFYDNGYIGPNGVDTIGAGDRVLNRGEDANANGILDAGEDVNLNGQLDGETPGIADADQVVWFVGNDLGISQPWTNVETGMELQTTIWGYARADALGNVLFKKYRLIYKGTSLTPSNATITNMYMAQWSDPDLGDSGNDFAGCDTNLSLGYTYNAVASDPDYADFNIAPPAAGYDFLQGPLVAGVAGQDLNKNGIDDAVDFGIFDLKLRGPGFINLPMTAFIYFAAGGTYSDPPFTAAGGIQWNQMLRGLPPTPQGPPDPPRLTNPINGQPTSYWLSGDPVAGTGWIDGSIDQPGDRRIILATGPFTMAVGDTQELVSAVVCGLGNDYKKSITVLKFNDRSVQLAYDNLFDLPKAPTPPILKIVPLENQLLLDWEFDSAAVAATENTVYRGGYAFEGYKIYQLPSASANLDEGIVIGRFDVVNGVTTISQEAFDPVSGEVLVLPVQFGSDNGIQRTLAVSTDAFRTRPLVNGQSYYFAVTAYNYTAENQPIKSLESPPLIIAGVPEMPKPGTRYPYQIGDTVQVTSRTPGNDADAFSLIYYPTRANGHEYQVRFDTAVGGAIRWSLADLTSGDPVYTNVTDLGGETPYRVADAGYDLYVQGAPVGISSISDVGTDQSVFGPASTNPVYAVLNPASATAVSGINGTGRTQRDFEIRFDGVGSYAVRTGSPLASAARSVWVPFSVWDIGRTSSDSARQVCAIFTDSTGGTPNRWDVTPNGFLQGGEYFRIFEPLTVVTIPYPGDSLSVHNGRVAIQAAGGSQGNTSCALYRFFIADKNFDLQPPPAGTTILFVKNHETRAGDTFNFSLQTVVTGDLNLAKQDVQAINVFPNPYYGLNRAETDRLSRFITFSHLPEQAVIRIFNLAGILVRTLHKNDPGTQFMNWDLQNENALPVASGMYLAYIELKDAAGNDLGTKTLKIAIIQEQQFLRNY